MKQFIIPLLICLFSLCAGTYSVNAQCKAKDFEQASILKMPGRFKHKHTFELTKDKVNSKGETEFSLILKRGTLYMLNIANYRGEEANIVVELYNAKRELVAKNYKNGKYWSIGYACYESGVHYFKFKFMNTNKYCGIGVLGEGK